MFTEALKSLSRPVLITGHTGFKGTWLGLLLNQLNIDHYGFALEAERDSLFDRLRRNDVLPGTIGDIRDLRALSETFKSLKPEVVVHMAAQPLVLRSYQQPLETFEVNVIGTANVLNTAFNTPSVKVVLVITTDKVYRNDENGRRFIESDPLGGKDPYSSSKVGAEAVCTAWRQISKLSGGPKVIVARAGNVIGGGDFSENRIIPDVVRSLLAKQPVIIRNPKATRPWQHVLDPLAGYISFIEHTLKEEITCDALNFGPFESSLMVQDLLDIGKEVLGERIEFNTVKHDEEKEAKVLELDANLASEKISWRPKWSQKEAIRSTFEWWRSVIADDKQAYEQCLVEIDELVTFKKINESN